MARIADWIEQMGESVTRRYRKLESGVAGGYRRIENGAVEGFTRLSNKCIEVLFAKEGESAAEARTRLSSRE